MPARLPQSFYRRDTREVARELLGQLLVLRTEQGCRVGRIVETEAYCGPHDLACHASKGRTGRTEVMFGPPGHWYVYLIYGMYHCLNVVTERKHYPAAVLIRGVAPLQGFAPGVKTAGPGKLCRAYGIDKHFNAKRGFGRGAALAIERGFTASAEEIAATPRVGIDYAGSYRDEPWRYLLRPTA